MGSIWIRITGNLMFLELTKHLESILNFVPSKYDILVYDDVNDTDYDFCAKFFIE